MEEFMDNLFTSILNPILAFFDFIIGIIFASPVSTIITGLILFNALGFFLMYHDKKLALYNGEVKKEHADLDETALKKQRLLKRRVPERTLMLTAAVGGSLGVLGGMYKFRHKTQKPLFKYGVPLIIILQIVFIVWNLISSFTAK